MPSYLLRESILKLFFVAVNVLLVSSRQRTESHSPWTICIARYVQHGRVQCVYIIFLFLLSLKHLKKNT